MAKLEFRYGAMNSGKSLELMRIAHNYEENDKKVIVVKSQIDTKGENVDIFLDSNAMLVDEAQFMSPFQIEELWYITKVLNIPIICFGLKTDFTSKTFPGSKRLLELSDELIELETICHCGKKARFNARKVNGEYTIVGEQNVIDGSDNIEYVPLCGECYINNVVKDDIKILKKVKK